MARKRYLNGDEVGLTTVGCDGCSPSMINGVLCHETGCPDAWRDTTKECQMCGDDFRPKSRHQSICGVCGSLRG